MSAIKRAAGLAELWLGDCRDILPEIEKADCIISDPPYLLTTGGNNTGQLSGCLSPNEYDNRGALILCDIDWPEILKLLFDAMGQGHAYVMSNNRNVQAMLNAAEAAGFDFHNLLVWDKVTATPNRWYMKNCEFTGFFFKGKARMINDCSSKQLIRCPQIDESNHPTEKPVALMAHYIRNSTQPGDLVVDPFMGSGSTGVAALQLGRRFIGIEKEEKHFESAWRRIAGANHQGGLF